MCVHATAHVSGSEDNFQELVLTFHLVKSGPLWLFLTTGLHIQARCPLSA